MKVKVGTVLDKGILQQLKERAAREGRSMSDIIEKALFAYFQTHNRQNKSRRTAVERLCSKPFRLSVRKLNEILEEDYFEQ